MATSPRTEDIATIGSNESLFSTLKGVSYSSGAGNDSTENLRRLEQERDQVEEVQLVEPSREEAQDVDSSFDTWLDSDSEMSVKYSVDDPAKATPQKLLGEEKEMEQEQEQKQQQEQEQTLEPEQKQEPEQTQEPEQKQEPEPEQQQEQEQEQEQEQVEKETISMDPQSSCSSNSPTEEQIASMIKTLRDSDVMDDAEWAIKGMDMAMDSRVVLDSSARNHTARTIVELDGVAIIFEAMEKWKHVSAEVTDTAVCVLVALTQIAPFACEFVARTGLASIVANAKAHPENYFLGGNVLALLLNLSSVNDPDTKRKVSSDECVDLVTGTMHAWPDKVYIQKCGASYFVRLNEILSDLRDGSGEEPKPKIATEIGIEAKSSVGDEVSHTKESADEREEMKSTLQKDNELLVGNSDAEGSLTPIDPPSDGEILVMLRALRDSSNVQEATDSVKELARITDSRFIQDTHERGRVANGIVRHSGVAVLIVALEKWHKESANFSYYAVVVLVSISKFGAKSCRSIAKIGCKTVLDTAKTYEDDFFMRANILALLQNLSNVKDTAIKEEVASSECIDCVVETMKKWPMDSFIQSCGCDYFARIGNLDGMPMLFKNKKIGFLIGEVFDNFLEVNDDSVYESAKKAAIVIHDNGQQKVQSFTMEDSD
eukprot:scaffold3359_cov123-Cylindrotheca_fusiformis.AAC.13